MRGHTFALCLALGAVAASAGAARSAEILDVISQDIARFEELLGNPVPQLRVEGIQGARLLRLPDFEPALLPLLRDRDPLVRRETVEALAECGTHKSIPALLAVLGDPDWSVREHARLALRRMTAEDEGWRKWWSATNLEHKQNALLAALESADPPARTATARALRSLATPEAEGEILKRLTQGKDVSGQERKLLTEALDRVGGDASLPYLLQRAGVGDRAAAWAVGRRGGPEAEEALLKGVRRSRTLDFLLNLDRVGSTKCVPYVPFLCRNFITIVRAGYGEDLRLPVSPMHRASGNLIRRTGHAPVLVDLILTELEGKADPNAVPAPLKPHFADLRKLLKPEFVREGVSGCDYMLGAFRYLIGDHKLVPRLFPLLKSPVLLTRVYAAMALGELRAPEAVSPLLEVVRAGYTFCDSTAPASGKHTAEFRKVDGKRVRQSQTVRWLGYFCWALGQIGTDEAREALESLAAAADSPRDVRYGSVIGLGAIGAPESLPVLRAVARDDIIWIIRDTAARTVADIDLDQRATAAVARADH